MSDIRTYPLVPLKNTVIFPILAYPVSVVRDSTVRAVDAALADEQFLVVFTQKDEVVDNPLQEELYDIGSLVRIVKNVTLPDEKRSIILEGVDRVELLGVSEEDGVLMATVEVLHPAVEESSVYEKRDMLRRLAEDVFERSPDVSADVTYLLRNAADDSNRLTDVIAMQLSLNNDQRQDILSMVNVSERIDLVTNLLNKELQRMSLLEKIHSKVRGDMDQAQREYVLREQMRAIQNELNDVDEANETEELKEKILLLIKC